MKDADNAQNNNALAPITPSGDDLFERVSSILSQSRDNVVSAVNSQMVLAYWLIGREIVLEIQDGEDRAEYGENVLHHLSEKLSLRFGAGYSVPNLRNFRQFFLVYRARFATGTSVSRQLAMRFATRRVANRGMKNATHWVGNYFWRNQTRRMTVLK